MKLYIKQKVFSWTDRFNITDASGREIYRAEGEFLSWGKKLHVYTSSGGEAAYIAQKIFSFLPCYYIYRHGREVAEIVKRFTFFTPMYTIHGLGWEIEGDFFAHNYSITDNGRTIITVRKEWFTWGDCYELDIADDTDEVNALCAALVIDCVMAAASSSAAT